MFDENGYPTEEILSKIATWPSKNKMGLIELVKRIWKYPEYVEEKDEKLYLSTGGWSGNEDIIQAMKENYLFWSICWEQSRRGGHYIFDLKRII